ncbi:MAG: exodeoxyribonuclease III [Mogibacterium sp.]|nr:exodeoxyribonuclease III [Mogibacterium sp.]
MTKFISWNVNGLRACLKKGFEDSMKSLEADFICIQETKMQEGQAIVDLPEYFEYYSYAEKKGYSGTAIFAKKEPISVSYNIPGHDDEGRAVTLEYEDFYLICAYVPNARMTPKEYREEVRKAEKKGEEVPNEAESLERFNYRLKWEDDFRDYLKELATKKHVVVCGDFNVAHREIDLKNAKSNRGNCGFSDEEREKFQALLDSGFVDTLRYKYPELEGAYSWWSYRFNARANNTGWRIDYFLVDSAAAGLIVDASIHPEIMGSDHCPVELVLNTKY